MRKVLIVDDDRATSAGMADVVEEWGYEAEVADTVKAGWSSVSRMVPDFGFVAPLLHNVGHAGAGRAIIVNDQHFSHRSPRGKESLKKTLSRSCMAFSSPPYVSAMSRAAASESSALPSGSV